MAGSVLVTGGGRRIGLAICETLRARGWNVLVHSREASNPLRADLGDPEGADCLFARACACAPDLCAIVNNAAEFAVAPTLPPEDAARLMRVNAAAPRRLTELLSARLAAEGRRGVVVNLLDVRVLRAACTPYELSKRALLEATREQAVACAPTLRVNAVAPGPILAPVDAVNRERGGAVLLGRRPTSRDVAEAVTYLLGAGAVTGQVLAVDAGQALLPVVAR